MRLGIVGGIHEDAASLLKALTLLKRRECDNILCLGDIVGFGIPYYRHLASRNAHAAIQLVRDQCAYAVVGNHDCFHARRSPKHSSFRYPSNWHDLDAIERERLSSGKVYLHDDDLPTLLTDGDITFLRNLPEFITIVAGEQRILASHYVYPNLVGDLIAVDACDNILPHLGFMRANGAQIALFSHDLEAGVRIFAGGEIFFHTHGLNRLPPPPLALNGPWIARGTETNGAMLLDTAAHTIEVFALGEVG